MKSIPEFFNTNIALIDIGAVGNPPSHWLPLKKYVDLIGFEPNESSCKILNSQPSEYSSSKFLPYAIGQTNDEQTFKITEHYECCSLLEPNLNWLDRFEYASSFKVKDRIPLKTKALDEISELKNFQPDALKIDAQGFELQILNGATNIINSIFLLEIETGLHKNYIDETTFEEICPLLKSNGFMCMEIFQQPPQLRNNQASTWGNSKGQAMACESIWMKDLLYFEKGKINKKRLHSFLLLCWLFNYSDYALEVISFHRYKSYLSSREYDFLQQEEAWNKPLLISQQPNYISKVAGIMTHLLPTPNRRNLFQHFEKISKEPNFFKKLFKFL